MLICDRGAPTVDTDLNRLVKLFAQMPLGDPQELLPRVIVFVEAVRSGPVQTGREESSWAIVDSGLAFNDRRIAQSS